MRHCGPSRLEVEMSNVENFLRNSQTRNGAQVPSPRVDRKRVIASSIVCAALVLVVLVIVVGTGFKEASRENGSAAQTRNGPQDLPIPKARDISSE